ncbi:hypothetical protein Gxy13693_119_003 [Komagataeibacter xylinus NBRC 13693]|uniref:Uncharacterized protein n=1 Tax=Komagataeibacter xylinus NBRC 13693 TaxID=1234668 RepID=A0A0D6QCE2_KOMXY|nr:hypothetical protein Gxy13693_119_003 [Komagataeibacter xylinus NBRC 13693]
MLLADPRASIRPPSDRAGLPPVGLVQKKQQDRAAEINAPPADEGADREALLRDTLRRKAEADANRLQDMIRRNKEYWSKS